MKNQTPFAWVRVARDAEYALDHSGSLLFVAALFIGSHLLNSPPYARFAFAVTLLVLLTPKFLCGIYRMWAPNCPH